MFTKWSKVGLITILLLPMLAWGAQVRLTGLQVSQETEKTRLVFEFSGPIVLANKVFSLKNPDRLVIDLKNTSIATKLNQPSLINTPVKDMRTSSRNRIDLRIVLDMKRIVVVRSFMLTPSSSGGYRLVIDLYDGKTTGAMAKIGLLKPVVTLPREQSTRDIIIVIDPGHGGKDPGTTGPRGVHEKAVVLSIARDLQQLLNNQPGFKAALTRKGDYFVSLRGRLNIARQYKADMFIAIHADAYMDYYARGVSVFALSQRGATSEAARWLAAKENESELGDVSLSDKSNMLRSVLIDLAQTATIGASLQIGSSLLHQLAQVTALHHHRVEQAAFVVLKSPDIPSVLVETGFLSNIQEEQNLRNPVYQHQIASALMLGIKNYFMNRPPPGTLLAAEHYGILKHVVTQNDTLSTIASHYGVSKTAIEKENKLTSGDVYVGQILRIPKGEP